MKRVGSEPAKIYHLSNWDRLNDKERLDVLTNMIEQFGRDPEIAELAVRILKSCRVKPRDYKGQAACLLKWVQQNIYYVNEPGERIQNPKYTLKRGFGDCDDMTILLCSLFCSIGLSFKLVLSGVKGRRKYRYIHGERLEPGVAWTHIYCAVGDKPFTPSRYLFCEPTMNVPIGWDVVAASGNVMPEMSTYGHATSAVASSVASGGSRVFGGLGSMTTAVLIGVGVGVGTELMLEYLRARYPLLKPGQDTDIEDEEADESRKKKRRRQRQITRIRNKRRKRKSR